jgi:hypothetical protein
MVAMNKFIVLIISLWCVVSCQIGKNPDAQGFIVNRSGADKKVYIEFEDGMFQKIILRDGTGIGYAPVRGAKVSRIGISRLGVKTWLNAPTCKTIFLNKNDGIAVEAEN